MKKNFMIALSKVTEQSGEQDCLIMANEAELAALRKCERDDCDY